jgi:hypothetical protein
MFFVLHEVWRRGSPVSCGLSRIRLPDDPRLRKIPANITCGFAAMTVVATQRTAGARPVAGSPLALLARAPVSQPWRQRLRVCILPALAQPEHNESGNVSRDSSPSREFTDAPPRTSRQSGQGLNPVDMPAGEPRRQVERQRGQQARQASNVNIQTQGAEGDAEAQAEQSEVGARRPIRGIPARVQCSVHVSPLRLLHPPPCCVLLKCWGSSVLEVCNYSNQPASYACIAPTD